MLFTALAISRVAGFKMIEELMGNDIACGM
jgi:hypothetical protein